MPKKQKIVIEYEALQSLIEEGKNITTTPKAEAAIVAILTLQEEVEAAIDEAKRVISEAALKINPNFSSIRSDKVKIGYKTYGQKYAIDESKLPSIPEECYSKKVVIAPNSKAIEAYLEKNKVVPEGVVEKIRTKSLSIALIKEEESDENA